MNDRWCTQRFRPVQGCYFVHLTELALVTNGGRTFGFLARQEFVVSAMDAPSEIPPHDNHYWCTGRSVARVEWMSVRVRRRSSGRRLPFESVYNLRHTLVDTVVPGFWLPRFFWRFLATIVFRAFYKFKARLFGSKFICKLSSNWFTGWGCGHRLAYESLNNLNTKSYQCILRKLVVRTRRYPHLKDAPSAIGFWGIWLHSLFVGFSFSFLTGFRFVLDYRFRSGFTFGWRFRQGWMVS